MQGTNAHVLIEAAAAKEPLPAAQLEGQWQRQRVWLLPQARTLVRRAVAPSAATGRRVVQLEAQLSLPLLAQLWDHQVQGRVVFPGAGYVELALASITTLLLPGPAAAAAGPVAAALAGVSIPAPLVLPADVGAEGAGRLPRLVCQLDGETGKVEIFSVPAGGAAGRSSTTHMAGKAVLLQHPQQQQQLPLVRRSASLARLAAALGLASRAASAAGAAAHQAPGLTGALAAPRSSMDSAAFVLHPASLDCVLQLGAVPTQPGAPTVLRVPAGIDLVVAPAAASSAGKHQLALPSWATAQASDGSQPGSRLLNYRLATAAGTACGAVHGLLARELKGAAPAAAAAGAVVAAAAPEMLFDVSYVAVEPAATEQPQEQLAPQPHVQLAGGLPLVQAMAASMAALQGIAAAQPAAVSVHGMGAQPQPLQLAGAAAGAAGAATAQLSGMLRSVALEAPATAFCCTQAGALCTRPPPAAADISMVRAPAGGAPRSVLGDSNSAGLHFEARLLPSMGQAKLAGEALQLVPRPRGALANLVPQAVAVDEAALAAGQVAVHVKGVGINFRSVDWAMWVSKPCTLTLMWFGLRWG